MTTSAYKRCRHCRSVYEYFMSGGNCLDENNNDSYCPSCMDASLEALKDVPPKFEEVWEDYDEVTIDQIKELRAKAMEEGGWIKTCMPLFDMNDADNNNITGIFTIDGKEVMYSYWTKKEDYSIRVKMEKNLETGEIKLWKEI